MRKESFLHRWSRLKSEPGPDPVADQAPAAMTRIEQRLPTLDDVAQLTAESDYSAFVSKGVDKAVQRLAMKKLFADPHFSLMDRLDVYIDDYTKADPVSPAMLASLHHARDIFTRAASAEAERMQKLAHQAAPADSTLQQTPTLAGHDTDMDGKPDGEQGDAASDGEPEAHPGDAGNAKGLAVRGVA